MKPMVCLLLLFTAGFLQGGEEAPARNLFSEQELPRWKALPSLLEEKPWTFANDAYSGYNSWRAHPTEFRDFRLTVDVRFTGEGQGGIVLRGRADTDQPWLHGYELDIAWAADREHGALRFANKPARANEQSAALKPNRWHRLEIVARGPHVTVALDGRQVLAFRDAEFKAGVICLEGHLQGVHYRRLIVTPLPPPADE